MIFLRSAAIWFLTLLFSIFYWLILALPVFVMFCLPTGRRQHLLRVLLLGFGLLEVRIAWRIFFKVSFRDLSGDKREPGTVIVNHRAATDAFLISVLGLSMAQTVNGWPMRLPVIGWMAHWAGYLDITAWDHEKLKRCAREIIEAGDMIASYPEGTRSEGKKMNPFHSGIFQVAKELEVPVYMLCIAGNQFMPDRKFRFREFRDLEIRFLEPVSKEEVRECPTAFVLKKQVFRRMEDELAEMDKELEK